MGEFAQALNAFARARDRAPREVGYAHMAGYMAFQLGQVDRGVRAFRRALALQPDLLEAMTNMAVIIPGAPSADHDDVKRARQQYVRALLAGEPVVSAMDVPPPQRQDQRRVVGYVSSFFTQRNYMRPVWALINRHRRAQLEVHLFVDDSIDAGEDGDELLRTSGYVAQPGDHVHWTHALSNADLAALAARHGMDLLVDLNSYSRPARLPVFTHVRRLTANRTRTAAWFNLFATSGSPDIQASRRQKSRVMLIVEEEMQRKQGAAHKKKANLTWDLEFLQTQYLIGDPTVIRAEEGAWNSTFQLLANGEYINK